MEPIASTRAQLFPNARGDAKLTTQRPPRIPFSARTWYWVIACMAATCFGLVMLEVVVGWTAPEQVHAMLGGTELQFDDDGDPQAFAGTWLGRLEWGALVAAVLTYALLRASIELPRIGGSRIRWVDYAAQRGLTVGGRPAIDGTRLGVFEEGRDRDWSGMCTGVLRGDVPVVVGATAWTTGSGKSQERHHVYFVWIQLPGDVASLFPGSSLSRFLRGITDVDLHPSGYDELRFESTSLDESCEIRVAGTNDEVRWRELFDPITLVGLNEIYDAQWQHRGRDIVFCAGGNLHGRAPVQTLDTLCLTAAFMYERFLWAARGDVDSGELAA